MRKKKTIPGTVQLNKLAADLPEKRRLKHRFSSDMIF